MSQVFKSGNVIGKDKVRVHVAGNRIDGVSKDPQLFYNDLPVPKRSNIDLSFDRKLSFDMGALIPILSQECVPGDTFHIAQAHNIMFAPLVSPVFQRIDYRVYYFFCPTRLVDDGWKDYITQKTPSYVLPYFRGVDMIGRQGVGLNQLCDYLDLPVQESNWTKNYRHLCAHVPRMYNLIWNEYFRDEFKQTALPLFKTGGICVGSELDSFQVRNIGWEKDYFTMCQTTPQVGSDVTLPVGIASDGILKLSTNGSDGDPYSSDSTLVRSTDVMAHGASDGYLSSGTKLASYKSGLKTTGTINDLRIMNHLQEYRDKLKIGGARYNEAILAEFGVVVPDYRIQRPEYIGGYASPVEIGRVMQTTPNTSGPLGSFAGSAVGSGKMGYIHYNALEHGYIIGLMCVMPRSAYSQGIPRQFIKDDLYSYYHPDFATLGDEQVYNDEIFCSDNSGGGLPNDSRFGYQQRYASYKMNLDRVNGEFRDTLSFWHMSREFASLPALNGSFVEADPTKRIYAVPSASNHIYAEIYHEIKAVRPMPVSVQPNLTNVE